MPIMINRCVHLTPLVVKPGDGANLRLFVQIQEFQMQAIMEYMLRMKAKKQEDIKNENPSNVKFSCRSCSQEVCTGRDIEIMANIHRVNVTPQFRWGLLHPEPRAHVSPALLPVHADLFHLKRKSPSSFFNRELFILKENTKLKNSLLDYETNGYIACGKCGQVGNRCEMLPIVHKYLV